MVGYPYNPIYVQLSFFSKGSCIWANDVTTLGCFAGFFRDQGKPTNQNWVNMLGNHKKHPWQEGIRTPLDLLYRPRIPLAWQEGSAKMQDLALRPGIGGRDYRNIAQYSSFNCIHSNAHRVSTSTPKHTHNCNSTCVSSSLFVTLFPNHKNLCFFEPFSRMASSIDSVGKRCAAVEQGHHELEAHFVNFMSDPRVETHPKRWKQKGNNGGRFVKRRTW